MGAVSAADTNHIDNSIIVDNNSSSISDVSCPNYNTDILSTADPNL